MTVRPVTTVAIHFDLLAAWGAAGALADSEGCSECTVEPHRCAAEARPVTQNQVDLALESCGS